jgi:hypothetical protein
VHEAGVAVLKIEPNKFWEFSKVIWDIPPLASCQKCIC